MIKTYSELIRLRTFEERFDYLKLRSSIGQSTFGFYRYANQELYHSREWRHIRRKIILRDEGCDLAIPDREIFVGLTVHHINPITIEDITNRSYCVFDINNLISTSLDTHKAIHFGTINFLSQLPKERMKGDTCPWKVF